MKIEWTKTVFKSGNRITSVCGYSMKLKNVPKDARIETVDGIAVLGLCESCGKPILCTEEHKEDSEGIYECMECYGDIK